MSNWVDLDQVGQVESIIEHSHSRLCLIYKHSTQCPISTVAANRLQADWDKDAVVQPYYFDLIAHRDVSNLIEDTFGVRHESPQILLIKDGKCVYHNSHLDITASDLQTNIEAFAH